MAAATAERTDETLGERQRYETLRAQLWNDRSSFESHWREIADVVFPVRPRFTVSDRNRGDRRNKKILNETATYSLRTLQSGLHAGLTSPARPWLKLTTPDPSLSKQPDVQRWLHEVTQRMLVLFNMSNLYTALPTVYGDMGLFGTAACGILEDPGTPGRSGDVMRAYPYPIGSYALGMDYRGLVSTFLHERVYTVEQLVTEFGGPEGQPLAPKATPDWTRFSSTVKRMWDTGNKFSTVEVCWLVRPNDDQDTRRLGYRGMAFSSTHFEKGRGDAGGPLRESGFHEFPVLTPRWHANLEDVYGTDCPGMTALSAINQLQVQERRKAQAIEKGINPPLQAPTHLRTQKVSMIPGDVTYADVSERQQGVRPIHEVKPDLNPMLADIQQTAYRIQRAFFEDLFLMMARSDEQLGADRPTAREIEERHEEKLIALGPVLERTNDELLDPLVDRTFAIMARAGLIPEPPQELQGVELPVEYTSILAQAQKMLGVSSLDRFMLSVAHIPDAQIAIDQIKVIRSYADRLGIDPDLVREDEEIAAIRADQQKQAQQMAAAEQLQKAGAGVKSLATAPTGAGPDENALTSITKGLTG